MRAARAKNAGTSDVYIGRRRRENGRTGEVQPMVTNEREKGEKVHMRGGRVEQGKNICVFAPVPHS